MILTNQFVEWWEKNPGWNGFERWEARHENVDKISCKKGQKNGL